MHFHWHNLNEKKNGKKGSILRHGRAWLYLSQKCNSSLRFEWSVPTRFLHFGVEFGEAYEDTVQVSFACGLFGLWLTAEWRGWKWLPTGRHSRIAFHNRALWIEPWARANEWRSADSWWVRGKAIHFDDLLLGKHRYEKRELSKHEVLIPMPEGCYPATVTVEERTWKRPRWFARTRTSCSVDIPTGIPHEGKGTASWNCGEDGLFGCGCEGDSIEKAIGHTVAAVLESRRRYGKARDLDPVISPRVSQVARVDGELSCPAD